MYKPEDKLSLVRSSHLQSYTKMIDFVEIETTPAEEDCAQTGTENYSMISRQEGKRMVAGVLKYFAKEIGEKQIGFKFHNNPHDFGSYLTIKILFNDNDEEAARLAYLIENELPQTWEELENGVYNPSTAEIAE